MALLGVLVGATQYSAHKEVRTDYAVVTVHMDSAQGEWTTASPTPAPTPAPTPTESSAPLPNLSAPEITRVPSPAQEPVGGSEGWEGIKEAFFNGYRRGGGIYAEDHIDRLVQCESQWRIVTGGQFLGLAQFHSRTWATVAQLTGYWDWKNPLHQGVNVAVWSQRIDPGSTQGWPVCWWRAIG